MVTSVVIDMTLSSDDLPKPIEAHLNAKPVSSIDYGLQQGSTISLEGSTNPNPVKGDIEIDLANNNGAFDFLVYIEEINATEKVSGTIDEIYFTDMTIDQDIIISLTGTSTVTDSYLDLIPKDTFQFTAELTTTFEDLLLLPRSFVIDMTLSSDQLTGSIVAHLIVEVAPTTTEHVMLSANADSTVLADAIKFEFIGIDTDSPVITDVQVSDVTLDSAVITWQTDELSTSEVAYTSTAGDYTASDSGMVILHSIPLTGLTPGTDYYYKVSSTDVTGNSTESDEYSFITPIGDSDGDGVTDDIDQCPDTPAGEPVDENGCSASQLDSDGDGVPDDIDQCPDTPAGEPVDENGCSASQLDSDGDGVPDDIDLCPDTPVGEPVDTDGCSLSQLDSDGDGVTDDIDLCPDTPAGEPVDENGCPASQLDSDGDGVPDDIDQCPDTPANEQADQYGCSASQLDGIVDNADYDFSVIDTWDTDNTAPGFFGSDYRYHDIGSGAATAIWDAELTDGPGDYEVFTWYPIDENSAINAPFTINHGGVSETVQVDQSTNGGDWVTLGIYYFDGLGSETARSYDVLDDSYITILTANYNLSGDFDLDLKDMSGSFDVLVGDIMLAGTIYGLSFTAIDLGNMTASLTGMVDITDGLGVLLPVGTYPFSAEVTGGTFTGPILFPASFTVDGTITLTGYEIPIHMRSEERRVGKECRSRWSPYH